MTAKSRLCVLGGQATGPHAHTGEHLSLAAVAKSLAMERGPDAAMAHPGPEPELPLPPAKDSVEDPSGELSGRGLQASGCAWGGVGWSALQTTSGGVWVGATGEGLAGPGLTGQGNATTLSLELEPAPGGTRGYAGWGEHVRRIAAAAACCSIVEPEPEPEPEPEAGGGGGTRHAAGRCAVCAPCCHGALNLWRVAKP